MFGLFKRKTTTEKLHDKYKSLIKQAYNLSKTNRSQSDQKYYEAEQILKEIDENKILSKT
ncbi:MAG: Lacal_2735 family protein [Flavobacteriales bacterium]|nr:Lacal_2735 family protein [Flavobacteriales bacterium]